MMQEIPFEDNTSEMDDSSDDRLPERWAPLGATSESLQQGPVEAEKLRELEEEQEQLNSSLLALTTHFAQVQFRLKQIVSSPPDEKEVLLKELEEFAFRGCPDLRLSQIREDFESDDMNEFEHEEKLCQQRLKQKELISQLKYQLEDLEKFAYESGEGEVPSSMVLEKQKVIIDELSDKMHLDIEGFDKLSPEDLRKAVDRAVLQIVNPVKIKEQLVGQLKTQIIDLERFIEFLQGEATSPGPLGKSRCVCGVAKSSDDSDMADCCIGKAPRQPRLTDKPGSSQADAASTASMRKIISTMSMFMVTQFGCGGKKFRSNVLKETLKGNHWGDVRAGLELSIDKAIEARLKYPDQQSAADSEYASDSEEKPTCPDPVVNVIRKDLCNALRDLLQHGLYETTIARSLVPLGCFPTRTAPTHTSMHAWDLFLRYYEMKHGRSFKQSPARKLSQSFSLEIVGGRAITLKQTLLSAIDTVLELHDPLKRRPDTQFKAFVCLALNEKKLVPWLRILLKTDSLVEQYYQPWSYVVKTGFDDALRSLDRLRQHDFNLPVDFAVRKFEKMKDVY